MNQIDEMHIKRIGTGKCDQLPCNIHGPLPTSTGGTGQEEKYEFVTTEEARSVVAALNDCGYPAMALIVSALEAERDAALQVAASWRDAATRTPSGSPSAYQRNAVEAEAKRLLSEKNGEKS